jgi:excisionase family DNA binding protein
MEVYTLKEAARHTKIGMETLKRACEEGLIKATHLPNRQWRIAESALEEALHKGITFAGPSKRTTKRPQPAALRKYAETHKRAMHAKAA